MQFGVTVVTERLLGDCEMVVVREVTGWLRVWVVVGDSGIREQWHCNNGLLEVVTSIHLVKIKTILFGKTP